MNTWDRQRIQSSINAILFGQVIAFDWSLPVKFLHDYQPQNESFQQDDPLLNRTISEHSFRGMCLKVFKICNHNAKNIHGCLYPSFNMIHYNLDSENILSKYLQEVFEGSSIDRQFFNHFSHSYLDDLHNKRLVYINPFAEETFNENDMPHQQETVLIFNPYTELMGLRPSVLKEMFHLKVQQEQNRNVHFRRLPTHNWIKNGCHIALSNHIQCLRDVLQGDTWQRAVRRHVSKKWISPNWYGLMEK